MAAPHSGGGVTGYPAFDELFLVRADPALLPTLLSPAVRHLFFGDALIVFWLALTGMRASLRRRNRTRAVAVATGV